MQAADELSFQPNVLARGLISGRTRTIGLLTDELGGRFSIPILLGAENALGNEQMSVLLCDARGDAIRRQHYIRTLLARQVDGFIVLGDSNDLRPSLTRDIPVPVVYVYCESTDPGDLSVLADDEGGARLAVEHLVSRGRRQIAHITGPGELPGRPRPGDRAAGRARRGRPGARGRRAAVRRVVPALGPARGPACCSPPTRTIDAIFCGNDQIASGAAAGAARPGPASPTTWRRRLRQLGGDRRRLPAAADHRGPEPGAARRDRGHAPLRRPRRQAAAGVIRQPCRWWSVSPPDPLPSTARRALCGSDIRIACN